MPVGMSVIFVNFQCFFEALRALFRGDLLFEGV